MAHPTLSDLFRSLPSCPSAADLEPVIELVVGHVQAKPYPLKSAAALLRAHRSGTDVADEVIDSIARTAKQRLRRLPPRDRAPELEAEHCGEVTAAALLGVSRDQLRKRLIDPLQRRALGYPSWDGDEFRFPLRALRATTQHGYVATLPEQEPLTELLPPWCRRG